MERKKCEIVLVCCDRGMAENAGLMNGYETQGFRLRVAVLPCGSKAEASQLLRILESGADGVEVIGCPDGSCRHLVGSTRAVRRVARVRALLDQASLGADRVGIFLGQGLSREKLLKLIGSRAEVVRGLGPPMRGVGR